MSLIGKVISGLGLGRSRSAPIRRAVQNVRLRAGYDAAKTTDGNRRHWAEADGLSADAATRPEIRRTLVMRSRYECANNCYARGIRDTLANDCIGPGPRLQMLTGDPARDEAIEQSFAAWAAEIDLAGKLRSMRSARVESGESLGVKVTNPALKHFVKMDLCVTECDRLQATFASEADGPTSYDGIEYDQYGNPTFYSILKQHPGALGTYVGLPTDAERVPARHVWHYFVPDRPEQRRGIPQITPALPLFANLRRFTLAVIDAAENAANHSLTIESDGTAEGDDEPDPMDTVDVERGTGMVLPKGWHAKQMAAEQPTTGHQAFVDVILREIGRCMNVPFTIAALDSSKSNLSAAYLDHQTYAKAVAVERSRITAGLEWILADWLIEAQGDPALDGIADAAPFTHAWLWPALGEHADPAKVANSQLVRLKAGLTDLGSEYAKSGREAEKAIAQQAKLLGLDVPAMQRLLVQSIYGNGNQMNPNGDNAAPPENADDPADTAAD